MTEIMSSKHHSARKVLLTAFQGEAMCFVHVLLNAREMSERGWDVKIIMEGSATALVRDLAVEGVPFHDLYKAVRDEGFIAGVCRACATKMGALEAAREQNLPLAGEMSGHPALGEWMEKGYQIITF